MTHTKRKKLIWLISGLVVSAVCLGGTTFALLFTTSGSQVNAFTKGIPGVEIIENSSETPSSDQSIPYQNKDAVKKVKIQNTGTIDSYIRVMLFPAWKETNHTAEKDISFGTAPYTLTEYGYYWTMVMGDVTLILDKNWKSSGWVYDPVDNYFYFTNPVAPGDYTSLLLESVHIENATDEIWENLQVEVLTDSIQAKGIAAQTVWPVSVDENGILELN